MERVRPNRGACSTEPWSVFDRTVERVRLFARSVLFRGACRPKFRRTVERVFSAVSANLHPSNLWGMGLHGPRSLKASHIKAGRSYS